jgi:hypothetical protein
VAVAGDVVCIAPGNYSLSSSFVPSHSGNSNAWITYTGYGTGAVDIVWTAGANASNEEMFYLHGSTFPNGPSYIEFKGLTLDGQNTADSGFFCYNAHHLKYLNNTITNLGSAGIASIYCDYQTADHNLIYHNGYNQGWSSGISFNSSQWFDTYDGIHNIVSNNIVAGSYDGSTNHTDGNGIIMDLSNKTYDASSANTPAALIVNNVVYGNGGQCIEDNYVTNIWVVNNTCYDNVLDLTLGKSAEFDNHVTKDSYYINNIADAWGNNYPFLANGTNNTGLTFSNNLIYDGTNYGTPSAGFTTANPDFINPPAFNATAGGQYAKALIPSSLGNGLDLQSSSPAIGAGIDPLSLSGINSDLKSDISACIYTDINGNPRPKGGPFTLGAYQQ